MEATSSIRGVPKDGAAAAAPVMAASYPDPDPERPAISPKSRKSPERSVLIEPTVARSFDLTRASAYHHTSTGCVRVSFKDRDHNAALNILRCFREAQRPTYLSRDTEQPPPENPFFMLRGDSASGISGRATSMLN